VLSAKGCSFTVPSSRSVLRVASPTVSFLSFYSFLSFLDFLDDFLLGKESFFERTESLLDELFFSIGYLSGFVDFLVH
jgi:hypothetical protein